MTLTNPGLESLKAGGPLSEDLFAGHSSVPSTTGTAPSFIGSLYFDLVWLAVSD